jgi:ACS family glucarate transporter-like MFS transporter
MPALLRDRFRWVLIAWMFAISATAYLDRVNISIAGQVLQKELKLSNTELGWIFSAFVLGYALSQAPGGRLADRYGPRRTLFFATLWWGIFTALTASISALAALIAVRFLLGVGEAVVYPASNRLVGNWIPAPERGKANGWIFAGVGAGAGIASPLITYLVLQYGWRTSFWGSAGIGVFVGTVWFLLCRDHPEDHPLVSHSEAAQIRAGLTNRSTKTLAWSAIFSSRDVLLLTLSYFSYGYSAYIFFTWFFIYLSKVRGLDLKVSSYYAMLPFLAMAVCSPFGGWLSDGISQRFGKRAGRCGLAIAGLALCAVFIACGTYASDARVASLVLAGGAGALYLSQSSFWSVTADIAGEGAGSVSGVMNMGNQIGGTITASLTPYLAGQFGWTASFLVAAGLCLIAAILWFGVDPEQQIESPIIAGLVPTHFPSSAPELPQSTRD